MGGTTAKLCFIKDGKAARTRTFEVDRVNRFRSGSGIPIAIPVYDLLEIGAGGGSIARVNDLGLLQVGPKSAGSDPGPACYGIGGNAPTVTDADLVLGFLNADYFLGGEMELDASRARTTIDQDVAKRASLSVTQAAWGIHNLVNETMASAARVYISDKAQAATGPDIDMLWRRRPRSRGRARPQARVRTTRNSAISRADVVIRIACGSRCI